MANTDEAGCALQPSAAFAGGGTVSVSPPALADEAVAVDGVAAGSADPLLAPSSSIRYPTINFC